MAITILQSDVVEKERVSQCQFRNKCKRWIRHEGYEPWVFCQIKNSLDHIEHPIDPKQVGLPPEDHLCEMDGRTRLETCDIYRKGIKIQKFVDMFPKYSEGD
jgi:hypothetical protein